MKPKFQFFEYLKLKFRTVFNAPFRIVVVGGNDGSYLSSVEILDEGSSEWRNGPELPFGIFYSQLVEDSNGGVILVGGFSGFYFKSNFNIENC